MIDMPNESSLPKFLIADDGHEREFVIHLHLPKFCMEILSDGTGTPVFLDSIKGFEAQIPKLMREAGDFFAEASE